MRDDVDVRSAVGVWHGSDPRILRSQVAAPVGGDGLERKLRGTGLIASDHSAVTVFVEPQRLRVRLLNAPPQFMERTCRTVGDERGDETVQAIRSEQLVDDDIAGHTGEDQICEALPDDLVRGGDRHDVTESLERDGVPIVQIGADRLGQTHRLIHRVPPRTSNGCDLSHPFKSLIPVQYLY